MARPPLIQKLDHGKLITKGTFPLFVETYNAVNARVDNLKGDYDVNPATGNITVDANDWEHPVIRFVGKLPSGSSPSPTISGYTGTITVFTGASLTSSAVVFSTMDLTYQSGLLVSASAGTAATLDAQTYDNV